MKTIQLLRLISIINSLLIIPACSAQNPSESLLEDVLEDLSVNNGTDNSVNTPNWENELEELSNPRSPSPTTRYKRICRPRRMALRPPPCPGFAPNSPGTRRARLSPSWK